MLSQALTWGYMLEHPSSRNLKLYMSKTELVFVFSKPKTFPKFSFCQGHNSSSSHLDLQPVPSSCFSTSYAFDLCQISSILLPVPFFLGSPHFSLKLLQLTPSLRALSYSIQQANGQVVTMSLLNSRSPGDLALTGWNQTLQLGVESLSTRLVYPC